MLQTFETVTLLHNDAECVRAVSYTHLDVYKRQDDNIYTIPVFYYLNTWDGIYCTYLRIKNSRLQSQINKRADTKDYVAKSNM